MARIRTDQLEAFIAFGTASIAVSEVAELVAEAHAGGRAHDLFVELEAAHARLRVLFAAGHDDAVCALAQNVLELAKRTEDALNKDTNRSGD